MRSPVLTIFKKELARFFGDRRMALTTILLPGLMIYVLYTFMGNALSSQFSVEDTFTIAPNKAYMIRNGKLAEPVRISVVTGSVMHTLHEIDGLTKDVKVCSLSTGGCGKMEQWPLRVAFGGPYVRVRNIQVQ